MTAKEFLRQAYKLDELIKSNQEELKSLKELSISIGGIDYSKDRVQSSRTSGDAGFTNIILQITELEKKIHADFEKLFSIKLQIRTAINEVQDQAEKVLLRDKYINFHTWDEISDALEVSIRTIHRIHAAALKNIKIPDTD